MRDYCTKEVVVCFRGAEGFAPPTALRDRTILRMRTGRTRVLGALIELLIYLSAVLHFKYLKKFN